MNSDLPPPPSSAVFRRRRGQRGFTLIELSLVAATIASVPSAAYLQAQQKADQTVCQNNLRNVGQAIQMHINDNDDALPAAAFYPADPAGGADSIRKILQAQGDMSRVLVCPSLPDPLQKKGLTFVYNDALAGQKVPEGADRKWLLTEFTCISSKAPLPHPGGYSFVFADCHVGAGKDLPASLVKAREQADELDKKKPVVK